MIGAGSCVVRAAATKRNAAGRRIRTNPRRAVFLGFGRLAAERALAPTVHVHRYEIGRRVGELLLARVAGEPVSGRRLDLGYQLAVRASA